MMISLKLILLYGLLLVSAGIALFTLTGCSSNRKPKAPALDLQNQAAAEAKKVAAAAKLMELPPPAEMKVTVEIGTGDTSSRFTATPMTGQPTWVPGEASGLILRLAPGAPMSGYVTRQSGSSTEYWPLISSSPPSKPASGSPSTCQPTPSRASGGIWAWAWATLLASIAVALGGYRMSHYPRGSNRTTKGRHG